MTVGRATQTNLPAQRIERSMNIAAIQPIALARNKQVGGHRPLPPMACASAEVFGEHVAGRGMQRYQTSLAELGATDGQHRLLEIDIVKLEVAGFAEAQARDTQEPEQTVVDPRAQLTAFIAAGHLERGAQEVTNLSIRVQIGSRSLWPEGQQALRRNLRTWIGCAAILRK
jgi:hypothetical protein